MIGLVCKIAEKNRIDVIEGPGIARTVPMQAGSSTIIDTLIQKKINKLWTRDDHILNFASCDCVLTTPINRDLLSKGLIKLADLKSEKPEVGHVICLKNRKYYIYNLFVKEKFDDKIYLKNIETCFDTLKMALEKMKYQTFTSPRTGTLTKSFSWLGQKRTGGEA